MNVRSADDLFYVLPKFDTVCNAHRWQGAAKMAVL